MVAQRLCSFVIIYFEFYEVEMLRISINELNLNRIHQDHRPNETLSEKSDYVWDSNPRPHLPVTYLQPDVFTVDVASTTRSS